MPWQEVKQIITKFLSPVTKTSVHFSIEVPIKCTLNEVSALAPASGNFRLDPSFFDRLNKKIVKQIKCFCVVCLRRATSDSSNCLSHSLFGSPRGLTIEHENCPPPLEAYCVKPSNVALTFSLFTPLSTPLIQRHLNWIMTGPGTVHFLRLFAYTIN